MEAKALGKQNRTMKRVKNKKKISPVETILTILKYAFIIFVSVSTIIPFIWMISSSFKLETEIFQIPIKWIPEVFHFENYTNMMKKISFFTYYKNTIIVSVLVTTVQVITSSMAAYSFSKLKYKGRDQIFISYLSTMMVPFTVIMVPLFIIVRALGLFDNLYSIVLLHAFNPFGVFLFRQFFVSIPDSLIEAARIDGATEFQIYRKIVMPLSKPAIGTLVIFTFVFTWNDFMGPLIFLSSDSQLTLQIGMKKLMSLYGVDFSLLLAGAVLAVLPTIILYILAQDFFVKGVANSGLKG